jgi:tyrosinase
MAATRRNITANQTDADRFVQATVALKGEASGLRASDLGIGPSPLAADRDLSTWDLFVVWHVWAMQRISVDGRRNGAHMGPVFLPWHRWYLLVLEAQMQRVLGVGRDDFGLPYWDWAADGSNLTPSRQRTAAQVWSIVGGNGRPGDRQVVDGPFTVGQFDIRIEQGPSGQLRATNRALRRNFGAAASRLPRQTEVDAALDDDTYDRAGWDTSASSFRNRLEGWVPAGPALHNRVHVWVGGDMGPGSSPNDPVFFLNHCLVDKLWDTWQQASASHTYAPTGQSTAGDPLLGHRAGDLIYSILTRNQPQIAAIQDVSGFYVYD